MPEKPDCYKCKHRGTLGGNAHSRCLHPEVNQDNNQFIALGEFVCGKFREATKKLNITGNEHGIKNGWFIWPCNFDPVWLESCSGFKEK